MPSLRSLILLLVGLLSSPFGSAATSDWPAVDPAVWALKAADLPGQPEAMILVDRYYFHRRSLERFRRVLVLTEGGRSQADIRLNRASATKLEGRTILPDGTVSPFVQGKDVVATEIVTGKRGREEFLKVFPPGVSGHCVVDIRWFEPIDDSERRPVPAEYGFHFLISLSTGIPVKRAEVMFDEDIADADWLKKFEVDPGQVRSDSLKRGVASYVFEDIPARKEIPLAPKADVLRPIFSWFWAPPVRDWLTRLGFPADKPVNMLDAFARTFLYEWRMTPLEKESGLKAELKAMGKGTEQLEAHARAQALIRLLRGRVRTLAELQDMPDRKSIPAKLNAVLHRGWGTAEQLDHLAFLLLKENGIEVAFVMAIDREDNKLMDPNNIWQYDQNLLAVKDPKGQWLFLSPGSTYEALGVSPWFQGSRALRVLPAPERLDWRAAFTSIPFAEPASNTQKWSASVVPGEESDAYSVALEATGSMSARWKRRLQDQRSPEIQKAMAPILERGRFRLHRAEGDGFLDPWKEFKVSFEGNLDHDGGRRRVIRPFPFLESPFAIPSAWPETRTLGINLPMACQFQAETRMAWKGGALPAEGLEPIERENYFGKVSWTATLEEGKQGQEVVVRLRVEIQRPLGSPMVYDQLKAFSGWVQDALGRTLPLPRS